MAKPLGRKKISRRKVGEKSHKNYFSDETQTAICQYQQEQDIEKKKEIYVKEIMPAFDALVQNLINVYGFSVMYESKTDLKNECMEFLYGVIPKFKAEKGSKAFSYFNVCGKNFCTILSKQNAKRIQNYISLSNQDALTARELSIIENHSVIPCYEETLVNEEIKRNITKIIDKVGTYAKTDNEEAIMKAVVLLFNNIDMIDLLGKRAILTYLREITGLGAKQLSISLSALKKIYKEIKKEAIND